MTFFKKNYQLIVLGILAVVFFFTYSYLSLTTPLTFNSPDETANYFFAELFAEEGRLWKTEPLEFAAGNSIFPRSIKSLDGRLVPVGFLGVPLVYGLIAKIIGTWSIIFLTPLFAVFAVLAFYGIIRKIFSDNVAFLSSILMFALPPFWYYATRGLFHNVLFVSFLIIAIYFLQKAYSNTDPYSKVRSLNIPLGLIGTLASLKFFHKFSFYALGGLFLGLALTTRLSELWWVAIICAVMFFIGYSDPSLRRFESRRYGILIIVTFFILAVTPFLFQNQILYGSPFATGYQTQVSNSASIMAADGANISNNTSASLVLPFGFHPKTIVWSTYNYYLMFFPWFVIPALLGIFVFLFEKKSSQTKSLYFLLFCSVTAWLLVYYGSWKFHDNIDPSKITIGTSYLRYWLPSFIMLTPFLSKFILFIANLWKSKVWRIGVPIVACAALIYLSFFSVFFAEDEGIFQVKQTLAGYQLRSEEVLEMTEESSIIITDRSDKIFFPERRIIYPLRSERTYNLIHDLVDFVPIYYYSISLPEEELEFLNIEKLRGVNMKEVKRWGNESLYEIVY
ncbi:MAG: hypothetical protein HQ536_00030 [Parcubacteria group bacterium]|nr:hypothetical protein [Parcubacteria group bacterium]